MTSQQAAGFLVHLYACELWFYSRVYGHSVIDCAIVTIIKYKLVICHNYKSLNSYNYKNYTHYGIIMSCKVRQDN